ncbi:MAG: TylF/MycF family methyltransferase, partial [Lachnospiraceae bacterium]|nr:TylF/MycF family methyltransferase [Lachnospiraceae bacterium]
SQIDLLVNQALKVKGDVAELGVYRGRLSCLLADKMKNTEKKLWLFDTFTGFDKRDLTGIDYGKYEDFTNTSESIVVNKILRAGLNKNSIVVRKGFFPDTAYDLQDSCFCFVSIDFDLLKPTRDALSIMWHYLSEGGVMIIHDYNNEYYNGVKEAVDDFVWLHNIKNTFILCDYCGTYIIKK